MDRRIKWGICTLVAAGAVGYGIYYFNTHEKGDVSGEKVEMTASPNKKKVLNVRAEIIKPRLLTDEITTTGMILPDEEVDLSFETSGKITQINFTEGTKVSKGDLLAKVNDEQLQAQLKKLEVQLQLANDRVFRQNALLEKEAVSKEAYEEVRTDLATLYAEIDMVKAQIALTELKAPFDGIIGLRQVSEGAYASPSTVVATLTKISPLKIEFSIPERYSNQVKNGTGLTFEVDGNLQPLEARVYAAESKVDPNTHTFALRALYPNYNRKILPGRFATVRLRTMEIKNAIAIPSESIVPEMGIDKVFLYKSGKATPVAIKKGIRNEERVQVLEGLNIGDTLIISGTLQLRTGIDVTLDSVE